MTPPAILVLGRYGDIINALPIAYSLSRGGIKPYFIVGKKWASILQGVSYVQTVVWDGDYTMPAQALLWFRRNFGQTKMIVAQAYMYLPDQRRLTDSYQRESWRIAGWLDRFGTIPTVFDQRNPEREKRLRDSLATKYKHPWILVAPDGISSKYAKADELVQRVKDQYPHHSVIDLRTIVAERIFDLLGVFDVAQMLFAVDTVHLHLARASRVPVVAITNLGWKGSVTPPTTIQKIRYDEELDEMIGGLLPTEEPNIYHVSDIFGQTERHQRARSTWKETGMIPVEMTPVVRTAQGIGDVRNLPYLKDILLQGMEKMKDNDVLVWTNDDITLDSQITKWAATHVGVWGAASMRRDDTHMGRDLFAFTKKWLKKYWYEIPDFILGAPFWDLVLAAIIRKTRGVVTTKQNLFEDFFPCETEHRYAIHEDHPSEWAGEMEFRHPANLHNRRLFDFWCSKECPTLKI